LAYEACVELVGCLHVWRAQCAEPCPNIQRPMHALDLAVLALPCPAAFAPCLPACSLAAMRQAVPSLVRLRGDPSLINTLSSRINILEAGNAASS